MKIKGYPLLTMLLLQEIPAGNLFEYDEELLMQTDGAYGAQVCLTERVRDGHVVPLHKTISVRTITGTLIVAGEELVG